MKVPFATVLMGLALGAQLPPPPAASPTPAAAVLAGSTVDSAGRPVPGLTVTASALTGGQTALTTDAKGHFSFTALVPGDWRLVTGIQSGYLPEVRKVTLTAGQEARTDFVLHRSPVLAGRVLDEDGNPVGGLSVGVRQEGYVNGRRSTTAFVGSRTDGLGEFRIVVPQSGQFSLEAETKPRNFQTIPEGSREADEAPVIMDVRTYYPLSSSRETASPVALRPDATLEGIRIVLLRRETTCVTASVAAPLGEATRQVSLSVVEAYHNSQSILAWGIVRPEERVRACGIPPGQYWVEARASGATTLSAAEVVVVAGKPVEVPKLYLRPPADITGRVVVTGDDADGKKSDDVLSKLTILAQANEGLPAGSPATRTAVDGRFTITGLQQRDYRLTVLGLPPHCYVQGAEAGNRDAYRGTVRPGAGELTIRIGRDGPTVSGTVLDLKDHPVAEVAVVLAAEPLVDPFAPNQLVSGTSGPEGGFTLTGEPPGPYRVFAFSGVAPSVAADPAFLQAHSADGQSIDLAPGEEKSLRLRVPDAIDR